MKLKALIVSVFALIAASAAAYSVREPLYCYHFDTTNATSGIDFVNVNAGTGDCTLRRVVNNSTEWVNAWGSGALGTANALNTKTATSLWLEGDGEKGLGCSTNTGFTLSFWVKPNFAAVPWCDFLSFRLGGTDYRFEYTDRKDDNGRPKFTLYHYNVALYTVENAVGLYTDFPQTEWVHFCLVWNHALQVTDLYLNGERTGFLRGAMDAKGLLEEIHMGSSVRQSGGLRNYQTSTTGVDELALYGWSVGEAELKWLTRNVPGPLAQGRAMPLCFHFDPYTKTYGVPWNNEGSCPIAPYKKVSGYDNYGLPGALGSAAGFFEKDSTTIFLEGDSTTGVGCSTNTGFTLSFWLKPPASPTVWSDPIAFRVGGANVRFEFRPENSNRRIYVYGNSGYTGGTEAQQTIPADVWSHLCLVWNHATKKADLYFNAVKTSTVTIGDSRHALMAPGAFEALYMGRSVLDENGALRSSTGASQAVLDEVALYNYSFSSSQVAWLTNNVPTLPPLVETSLARTVSGAGAWDGAGANWLVDNGTRRMIWPACEDAEATATLTVASAATLSLDAPVRARVDVRNGAASAVALALTGAGSMFAPQALTVDANVAFTLPCGVTVAGTVTLGAGARLAFDASSADGAHPALTAVGGFTLPAGVDDVLACVDAPNGYTASLSQDGTEIWLTPGAGTVTTARWVGTAGDGDLANAANWECRNADGDQVENKVPTAETTILMSGATTLSVPAGATLAYRAFVLEGTTTLSADCDWRGLGRLAVSAGVTIDLAGHVLRLADFDGVEGTTATVTDGTGGGDLHVDVPPGKTVRNGVLALTGAMKLVKDGAGTFIAAKSGQSYAGGTEVAAGSFLCALDGGSAPLGASAGNAVRVAAGAVFDLNGSYRHTATTFTLAGGTLRNGRRVAGALTGGALVGTVRLEADSFFDFYESHGLIGASNGATTLDLAGHLLTVDVGGTNAFYLCNTDVSAGTIDVRKGGWIDSGAAASVRAPNVSLLSSAAFNLRMPVSVQNLTTRSTTPQNGSGAAVASVSGTYTPAGTSHPNVQLLDGSTIDLSGRTGTWSARSVHSGTSTTNYLTVASGAAVTVKLSARDDLRDLSKSTTPYVLLWDGADQSAGRAFGVDAATDAAHFYVRADVRGIKLIYRDGSVFLLR